MGTARRETYTFSPGFSRADESSPDAARNMALSGVGPLSGRTHSRVPGPSQRKENSSRGPRQLLRICTRGGSTRARALGFRATAALLLAEAYLCDHTFSCRRRPGMGPTPSAIHFQG
ncbi:hypothetical protein G5714_024734 [Onychostoma macrolepis]|uniref:Uncharacterized protein n=1 Tax=Onychostoma macrolepis TaxID=369639 RepID=A0A7J6BHF0_9TELE|nr:hypothetical protein G5714_024734 [Onychostoma macrolepis]